MPWAETILSRIPGRSLGVLVPVALVLLAAAVREVRFPVLVLLVVGFVAAASTARKSALAWAAPLPVAVSLAWGVFPQPSGASSGADCASITSPPAVWRLAEAALALSALFLVARLVRATGPELGLVRPGRTAVAVAAVGGALAAVFGLLAGSGLAAPFFGPFRLDLGTPAAYLPAAVFAVSNGVMEEVIYRGALLAWLARVIGPIPSLAVQAVAFGFAHAGPDIVGSAIPVILVMTAGGLIAGAIVLRTRSLVVPIAIHVALDLPLYFYWACRVA